MKKLKAWAVVDDEVLDWHENRPMIYKIKKDAIFNCYKWHKVIPCIILLKESKKRKKR